VLESHITIIFLFLEMLTKAMCLFRKVDSYLTGFQLYHHHQNKDVQY